MRVWDRYRRQQADWGDAATQAALAQISASHQRWHTLYLSSLGLAGLLLAAGLLLSRQAERLKAAARKLPPPLPAVSKGSAPLQRPMAVHPPPDARRSPQAWSSIARAWRGPIPAGAAWSRAVSLHAMAAPFPATGLGVVDGLGRTRLRQPRLHMAVMLAVAHARAGFRWKRLANAPEANVRTERTSLLKT